MLLALVSAKPVTFHIVHYKSNGLTTNHKANIFRYKKHCLTAVAKKHFFVRTILEVNNTDANKLRNRTPLWYRR